MDLKCLYFLLNLSDVANVVNAVSVIGFYICDVVYRPIIIIAAGIIADSAFIGEVEKMKSVRSV